MYNPIRIMAEIDAEDRKEILEGFVGMALLTTICFMLGGVYV
jgi:hypothetical protein